MNDNSSTLDAEEYLASLCDTNKNSTSCLMNLNNAEDDSSDEVEFIKELKIGFDEHPCDLCCEGTLLLNKLLRFGGILDDVNNFACDICFEGFKTKPDMTEHKKVHENGTSVDNLENGNIQTETFSPIATLNAELTLKSAKKKNSKKVKSLKKHRKTKHRSSPHVCMICDLKFPTFKKFKNHCATHKNLPKLLMCPSCKKRFLYRRTLMKHICVVES
ncbi:hypothetical protein NPIL_681281 [Nephila pilipes]|uniref:C2H2-type domain-containing protein n=1 Tax=Nephila pilipes TaxID=299642 RepID=A0A8X6T7U6_NEPPI|nr:hypothetical protein NPIL_681281 [Nephila pilipes]